MTEASRAVTLADIEECRDQVGELALETPVETSRWLSALTGGPVALKCENLQRTGSFKTRGAYLRMSRLAPEERAAGVVAASAGNHAQGVALAATTLGIASTVFMPEGAPIPKVNATRGYGADVRFHGRYLHEAMVAARQFSEETGAVFIHPYDHPDIVTGQGTLGLEVLDQFPAVQNLLVPLGGGGLLAGVAIAVKALRPDVRIIGVQATEAAAYPASLEAGRPIKLEEMATMADGIAVGVPGDINFAAVRDHVDEIVTVSEDSLARAVLALVERAKLVAEPAGAAAVAAVLDDPTAYSAPTLAVISGGNVDPLLLSKIFRSGLAAAGRYLNLNVRIPDLPGGLATLLTDLAGAGANVLEVAHERINPSLAIHEVEVGLQLETRGDSHAAQVHEMLRERGYRVVT